MYDKNEPRWALQWIGFPYELFVGEITYFCKLVKISNILVFNVTSIIRKKYQVHFTTEILHVLNSRHINE